MEPLDKPTSLTLLQRVRDRDQDAWRRLLHLYGPLVMRWCGLRGVVGQDADDVQQEVFQAVAVGLDDFRRDRPGDTFRGWLRGITRNKLLDHYRRRGKMPAAQGGTEAHLNMQQVAEQEWPDDTVEDVSGLYHRALDLVKNEFEQRTWEAFWRAAVEGQAPALIAADLGVTPAAVRKAKSRVLHRLREELGIFCRLECGFAACPEQRQGGASERKTRLSGDNTSMLVLFRQVQGLSPRCSRQVFSERLRPLPAWDLLIYSFALIGLLRAGRSARVLDLIIGERRER